MIEAPFQYPRSAIQLAAAEALKLSPEILKKLRYEWDLWALPHQVPPAWDWSTWLQIGGRGCGKNVGASNLIRKAVEEEGVQRINLIGRTAASTRDDMVRGEAGILAAFPRDRRPVYVSSQSVLRFHTGAEALMLSAEEPSAIQGKNAELTWLDEFSTYGAQTEEVWTQATLANRVGRPRKIVTTNSLPDNEFLWGLIAQAEELRIAITRSTSYDNFSNLPEDYQRQIIEMSKTSWGRAWITGERFQPEGALWKDTWFRYLPVAPAGGRTVVSVDPAGTEFGDETGIIVAKRVGDFGYVVEDLSGHHDAEKWPAMVVDAARRHHAACIVIERNRGLDFLRALIRPLNRTIPLKEINVTNRKDDRAYPIAALYELKKIFHCPQMPALEKQMCNWDPKSQATQRSRRKATSPDRIDALVHAISELGFHLGVVKGLAPGVELPQSRL
jgi:phage terminase large subunit-like protein